MDFQNAFDNVTRVRLTQRLEALGVPTGMQWGIYAFHESMSRKVWFPSGLSEAMASTIRVKQGWPLSSTLFHLYIDEGSNYIKRFGDLGERLPGTAMQILLYVDNIVMIFDSPKGFQRHLNTLKVFCRDKGLTINMDKTKVMVFNAIPSWVTRSEPEFF